MKHIKEEMTKNHLQFVRFEATDLHGVSRSKSIPAHFFQVSFASRVMIEYNFIQFICKQMVLIALSYFIVIYTAILVENQSFILFLPLPHPRHITVPLRAECVLSAPKQQFIYPI